jgi:4-amino-4-deoxy-L-arabinose transferase-like glycosyltransferase
VPALVLTFIAVLNLLTLMRTPPPFWDEAWFASRAMAQVQTGFGFGTLDSGILSKYDGYWTVLSWLLAFIQSIPIRLFGPDLFYLRLESLIFGIAVLAVLYAIVKKLYNARAALLTIVVGALSLPFIYSSHLARPDIIIVLCGFGAVALYLYDRSSKLTFNSIFSGLLIGFALDIHPNISIFGPVMLGLYLLDYGWRTFRTGRFWGFALGVSAGLVFYITIHILPYPHTYVELNHILSSLAHTPPILMPDPQVWLWTLRDTFWLIGALQWPLILGAIVLLARRHTHSDKRLLIISLVLVGSFATIILNRPIHYAILIAPAVWMPIGVMLDYLLRQPWRRTPWVYARTVIVLSLLLTSMMYAVAPMRDNPAQDWQTTLDYVRQTLPPGSKAIGQQNWWFARPYDPYLSWEQLVYHRRYAPGSTLEDAFRDLNPQYLVMDRTTEAYLKDELNIFDTHYFSSYVLRSEMETFMESYCRLVSTVTTPAFGEVRIYKIEWSGQSAVRNVVP